MQYQYQSLVESAKKGDRQAMAQLLEHMKPLIFSAIRRYGKGEDREDLYQDACILLIESVYNYNPDREVPFLSYIKSRIYYGIFNRTRNRTFCISMDEPLEERENKTLGDVMEDPEARVEEKVIEGDEKTRLIDALNRLSEKQRQVIELHYFSGVKLKDIAGMRDVHYKGVLQLKERALKILAESIK